MITLPDTRQLRNRQLVKFVLPFWLIATIGIGERVYAHTSLVEDSAPANTSFRARFVVAHGCDKSPTHTVRIQIPLGVEYVSAWHKPDWNVRTILGATVANGEQNPTVVEVIWTGSSIPANEYDYFEIQVKLPDEAGKVLYFKTIQLCDLGDLRWIEIPEDGRSAADYEHPAPSLTLVQSPEVK